MLTLQQLTSQSNQWSLAQHDPENKMTFCPRNYIIVHFHTNTQRTCLAPPAVSNQSGPNTPTRHDSRRGHSASLITQSSCAPIGFNLCHAHTQTRQVQWRRSGRRERVVAKRTIKEQATTEWGGGVTLCDYAESDGGGKELELELLAWLSLQAVSSVAACLFSIRFTDFGWGNSSWWF